MPLYSRVLEIMQMEEALTRAYVLMIVGMSFPGL